MEKITFDCGGVYCYKGTINGEITIEQNEDLCFIAYSQYGEKMIEHYGSLWTFLDKLVEVLNEKRA